MIILAFDTCFSACSVALRLPGHGRANSFSRFSLMEKGHSERLVPMMSEVITEAQITIGDVDAFAVTTGPGSFTGVRTGIASARALALATGKPVHGTSSLHVMALGMRPTSPEGAIAIAISTRDGLIYFQTFDGATASPKIEPCLISPQAAVEAMGGMAAYTIGGTGAGLVATFASQQGLLLRLAAGRIDADAARLANIAHDLPVLNPPRPLYLREPDAKPQAGMPVQRTDPTIEVSA